MNWISTWSIAQHHHDIATKASELNLRWNVRPSPEQLHDLREILESYLEDAETDRDKEIITGILSHHEFFERAILVTDGSSLALRVYAWTYHGKIRMTFSGDYDEAKHNAEYNEYLYSDKHSVEEIIQWILDHYSVIPFQCASYPDLLDWEMQCAMDDY